MITVTLRRSDLVERNACVEGLVLYDSLAAMCPPVRVRLRSGKVVERRDRIRVRWTPLAQVWLARAFPAVSSWLFEVGFIPRISLARANLDGAYLRGANLRGANLARASLDGASLDGASLDGASLDGASLDGASLDGASLVGASLVGAYLRGANLARASLDGASLDGASLDGAWRDNDDPAIAGWRLSEGRLVRADGTP